LLSSKRHTYFKPKVVFPDFSGTPLLYYASTCLLHEEILDRDFAEKIHILRLPLNSHDMESVGKHFYLYRVTALLQIDSLEPSMPVGVVECKVVNGE
jgi:hypothetical protein